MQGIWAWAPAAMLWLQAKLEAATYKQVFFLQRSMGLAACWVCFWIYSAFGLSSSVFIALVFLWMIKVLSFFDVKPTATLLRAPLEQTFFPPAIMAGL